MASGSKRTGTDEFRDLVVQFCRENRTDNGEDLLKGMAWGRDGSVFFRMRDLLVFLAANELHLKRNNVAYLLSTLGGGLCTQFSKGHGVNVYYVPESLVWPIQEAEAPAAPPQPEAGPSPVPEAPTPETQKQDGNVVSLRLVRSGDASGTGLDPEASKAYPELVEAAKWLLSEAESGSIKSIAFAALTSSGGTIMTVCQPSQDSLDAIALIGSVTILASRMPDMLEAGSDD